MSGKQGDLFGAPATASPPEKNQKVAETGREPALPKVPAQPTVQRTLTEQLGPPRGTLLTHKAAPVIEAQPPAPAAVPAPVPAWRRPAPVASAPVPAPVTGPAVLTVSQLTKQVKDALEPKFTRVLVRGEISNFRGVNARGHLYFALTDARSSIDVKLWATTAARLKFQLKDGLSVIIEGNLDVYEPQGRYSLIVEKLEPEGLGAQALRFEQLKAKLVAEGLIGDRRTRPKRELPFLPRRVGVVTSISGAALRDFLKVLHRRHPGIAVLVADARVQGDGAVFELRRALRWLSRTDVDVIVVTRGGGSADDLWTFNEEPVVRALWACPVPVVSAVGHEIDVTLSDLVADVRAPTPSAAAELVAPSLVELRATLATLKSRAHRSAEKLLERQRSALVDSRRRLGDPRRELSSQRLVLSNGADRMRAVLSRVSRVERARLSELRGHLGDPRHDLARARPILTLASQRLRDALRKRHRNDSSVVAELKSRLRDQNPREQLLRRRERLRELGAVASTRVRELQRLERTRFGQLRVALQRRDPRPEIRSRKSRLIGLRRELERFTMRLASERQRLDLLHAQLAALNPLKVLERGFALARAQDRVIRRAAELKQGEQFELVFSDGSITVRVVDAKPKS